MKSIYHQHWEHGETPLYRSRALAISVAAHAVVAAFLFLSAFLLPPRDEKITPMHLSFVAPATPEQPPAPPKKEVTPPPPKPEPPKPEPPKPEPEKKPEPQKPKPVEKKPDPPKPKPVEKKPEPPKPPTPKKVEPLKELPIPEPLPDLPTPLPELPPPPDTPRETGMKVDDSLPSELTAWARLVHRKVYGCWSIPSGVPQDDENSALVVFRVDKNGNLLGPPEIKEEAKDPRIGASALRAIQLASPLPPFPAHYTKAEERVMITFTVVE